ncbi:unnamed protein product [Gongylonema pulchrum]|uniref:Uncharacterized protein n=1 Tax=Gongylonema pulchrum TaxID=637853 RepID=A0A3P6TMI5_9BILA|nr:unnamed protein product [Gongylonema pulchrum]
MVLNDGILWDLRMGTECVHKFDRLSANGYGVFHPHGNEWDVRNFKLLHSVSALDQCAIVFSGGSHVIYAGKHNQFLELL